MARIYNVGIVGAGFISETHIEVLKSVPNARVVAVVDQNVEKAKATGSRWGIAHVHSSVEAMLSQKTCDVAHVLVPSDRHGEVATTLLEAGLHVFVEKPLGTSTEECQALIDAADRRSVVLGVNQNALFFPAYLDMKNKLRRGELGNLRHVVAYLSFPLRQLAARQWGHFMFLSPQNIVLEMGAHALSQIYDLAGNVLCARTLVGQAVELAPGRPFYKSWQVSMHCERASAQFSMLAGHDHAAWGLIAMCDDGLVGADMAQGRVFTQFKTQWPDFFDSFQNGVTVARQVRRQSYRNAREQLLALLGLRPRSDTFFLGMKRSIAAFYSSLDGEDLAIDGRFGARVVGMCEQIAKPVLADASLTRNAAVRLREPGGRYEVALLGGTGFIGAHLMKRLLQAGLRVGVMARHAEVLPAAFGDPRVEVFCGDVGRPEDVERAIGDAKLVVNLAHAGGASPEDVERVILNGARTVAQCCLEKAVEKLIYLSSIAALYLGDDRDVVTGGTFVDRSFGSRGVYARAKAASEKMLLEMYREKKLPVCILRPGIVVGEGGFPFHSGLGVFHRDQHCIGWNRGENPLPLVLVEDVAEAIRLAMDSTDVAGRTYNVVGDVRLTAREYVAELGRALGRPLRFHPQSVVKLQTLEIGKWLVKRMMGRRDSAFPSFRDLKSRGMRAPFDCADIKGDLNWKPVGDRGEFIRRGIEVYRKA